MSLVSNAVQRAVNKALETPSLDIAAIAFTEMRDLDASTLRPLAAVEFTRRVKQSLIRQSSKQLKERISDQLNLPLSIDGAVIRTEGKSTLNLTTELDQKQFLDVIARRKKKIDGSVKSLDEWTFIYRSVLPYWKKDPKLSFGECLEMAEKDRKSRDKKKRKK